MVENVAHQYFAQDTAPKLQLTARALLGGYAKADICLHARQERHVELTEHGYPRRDAVASTFMYWLQLNQDGNIVHEISAALEQGEFTPANKKTIGSSLPSRHDLSFRSWHHAPRYCRAARTGRANRSAVVASHATRTDRRACGETKKSGRRA